MPFPLNEFITEAKRQNKKQAYIDSCVSYASNLISHNYPVLFSLEHLAIELGVQSDFLKKLIGEQENSIGEEYKYARYNYFKLKKRNGAYREIMSPSKDLKFIQKWILVNILSKYELNESCKGFRKGISIFDNAKLHEKAGIILRVDLLKFYDTITEKRVYGMFSFLGYSKNLCVSLAKIVTAKHRDSYWSGFDKNSAEILKNFVVSKPAILPQGAPTSPTIANILASSMDKRFDELAIKMNFNYSRYADDLTFSISNEGKLPSLKLIEKIITAEGFFINTDKTLYQRKGSKQYVTGLTTTNGVNVSKKYRKNISEHIYYCRKLGVQNHLKKRKKEFSKYNPLTFHDWLYGHICFINSINKRASDKLLDDFNKIDWFV